MEGVSERESILQNVNRKNQSVLKETNSIILLCIQSSFLGISQKIRFARVCAAAKYFISRSLPIASKPLTHSHRYHRFYKCIKRFDARNKELLFKYELGYKLRAKLVSSHLNTMTDNPRSRERNTFQSTVSFLGKR